MATAIHICIQYTRSLLTIEHDLTQQARLKSPVCYLLDFPSKQDGLFGCLITVGILLYECCIDKITP